MGKRSIMGMVAALLVFAVGCDADSGKDGVAEYRAEDAAYYDRDSCVDRYLLYTEDGTYERYIGGTYQGKHLDGAHWGTLFETGTYAEHSSYITFSQKKQYDFDTGRLENVGLSGQVPYSGTIDANALTITWEVWLTPFDKRDVPIVYRRK